MKRICGNCFYRDQEGICCGKCSESYSTHVAGGYTGCRWFTEKTELKKEAPYLFTEIVVKKRTYNPNYGDFRECQCGHPYHRHFDSYQNMQPIGCKYCPCYVFMEKTDA